jgi:hypothetical protein
MAAAIPGGLSPMSVSVQGLSRSDINERDRLAAQRDAAQQRAERMAAQLRAMGVEPGE